MLILSTLLPAQLADTQGCNQLRPFNLALHSAPAAYMCEFAAAGGNTVADAVAAASLTGALA